MIRLTSRPKPSEQLDRFGNDAMDYTFSGLAKRTLDFTAALIGLIFLAPFFVLIAILIKRDSPGFNSIVLLNSISAIRPATVTFCVF